MQTVRRSREQITIIGAGPCGCAAAVQCLRMGIRPLLLDQSGTCGGLIENAFLIENYPGLEQPIEGLCFVRRLGIHLARFGITVDQAKISHIKQCSDRFKLISGTGEFYSRSVIIAVGTTPRRMTTIDKNYFSHRCFYEVRELFLKTPESLDDAKVVIIGGGEAGFDYARSLAKRGFLVTILIRGNEPKVLGQLRNAVEDNQRITIKTRCSIQSVSPIKNSSKSGTVSGLCLKISNIPDNRVVVEYTDFLLAAIGRQSALKTIELEFLNPDQKLLITEPDIVPGFFVAGDARHGGLGQVGMAVGDGLWAAAKAADYCY